jgi:hypothetical protein
MPDMTPDPAAPAVASAPSGWYLERAMSIAQQALAAADQGNTSDAITLLGIVREAGVDVRSLMQRLCLSADEDDQYAAACKLRENEIAGRRARFERHRDAKRAAIFGILQALPELFPKGFKDALAEASIRRGKDGIVVIDQDKLPERFIKVEKTPKKAELAEAILKDGEIIPGAEKRNGAPYLFLKVS